MIVDYLPILMLAALVLGLFSGLPVAIVLGGLGIAFSLLGVVLEEMPFIALYNIPLKMWGAVSATAFFERNPH